MDTPSRRPHLFLSCCSCTQHRRCRPPFPPPLRVNTHSLFSALLHGRLSPNTGVVGMPPPSAPQQVKIVNAAPSPYPHPGVVPQQHMGSAPLEVPAAESEEEKQVGDILASRHQ